MILRKLHALVMGFALSALGTRWVYAKGHTALTEGGMAAARGLHEVSSVLALIESDATPRENGSRHLLTINGARVRLQSAWLSDPDGSLVGTTLERVRADCQRPIEPEATARHPLLKAPLLEQEMQEEGYVFCLKPLRAFSVDGLERSVDELSKTGDFTSFGRFQGVYVRRSEQSTLVLTVEILEGFSPESMFPRNSAGPGSDIAELPRPPGRRLLSIGFARAPALTNYLSVDTPDKTLEIYEHALVAQGVKTHRKSADSPALFAQTGDDTFIVNAAAASKGTVLTIARLPE